MVTTYQKIQHCHAELQRVAPQATFSQAHILRRAAMTLHRWYEAQCNGNIQRDEETGIPYHYSLVNYKRIGQANDRERGAEKTIGKVCAVLGLHYYLQTDPRGGTLYVDSQPIPDDNYNRATFIA